MRCLLLRLPVWVGGALLLLSAPAEAEVQLRRPSMDRVDVVSDGVPTWKIGFATYERHVTSRLIPVDADHVFFAHGCALHLIDTRKGVVIRRWIFPDGIDEVHADGAAFRVQTSRPKSDDEPLLPRSTLIGLDLPAPAYWIDNLLLFRVASLEGSLFDRDSHFDPEFQEGVRIKRIPLVRQDAEQLLLDVKEAARRNPFQARLAVVEALLMNDAGRQEEADAVFRDAMDQKTNHFGELFWIAAYLEYADKPEWSRLAFDRASETFWKEGSDPRLVSFLLPRLIMGYLPYELRTELPVSRRAELSERLYRMAPYVQGSSAAWSALASYFDENGDPKQAALWRGRAAESVTHSGYIWEFGSYAARAMWFVAASLLAVIVYGYVLHRRYALQRRLLWPGWANWLHRHDPRWSLSLWNRRDRLSLAFVLLLFWLGLGAFGVWSETAVLTDSSPISAGAGSYRAPVTRVFLESLAETPERNFLLAFSMQQQGEAAAAESLYRKAPHSAEAWNNLGVLEADQGRIQESGASFRKALDIDPQISEAALNLGRPTEGYWADIHRRYSPGQKMLATPSHDLIYRATRGDLSQFAVRILPGPFIAARAIKNIGSSYYDRYSLDSPLPIRLAIQFCGLWTWGLSLILCAWLLILYRAPYQEVIAAPARGHWLLELVVPGTSRRWKVWGGLLLTFFVYGVLETAFHRSTHTWFTLTPIGSRALGLSDAMLPDVQGVWPPDASSRFWTLGPEFLAALIFALNAVAVLRDFIADRKQGPL